MVAFKSRNGPKVRAENGAVDGSSDRSETLCICGLRLQAIDRDGELSMARVGEL